MLHSTILKMLMKRQHAQKPALELPKVLMFFLGCLGATAPFQHCQLKLSCMIPYLLQASAPLVCAVGAPHLQSSNV